MLCLVEPTEACNITCAGCPGRELVKVRKPSYLDMDAFGSVALSKYIDRVALYNRGEAFLHPRFTDMVRILKERGVYVSNSTNGLLLEKKGEDIVRYGLDELIIAVDGLTPETYLAYRTGSDFERVMAGIRYMVEARERLGSPYPRLVMQFIIFESNVHELDAVEDFAREHGFDELQFKTTLGKLAPKGLDREKLKSVVARKVSFRKTPRRPPRRAADILKYHGIHKRFGVDIRKSPFCFSPVLLSDSSVVACCWDIEGNNVIGRVGDGVTFDDVLEGDVYRDFLGSMLAGEGWEFCRAAGCPSIPCRAGGLGAVKAEAAGYKKRAAGIVRRFIS